MTKKTASKTRRDFLEFELEAKYLKIDKLIGQRRIANQLGVKISTIGYYSHPAYAKRTSEEKGRRLIEIWNTNRTKTAEPS